MSGGVLQYSKLFPVCIPKTWRGGSSPDTLVYTKGWFEIKLRHAASNIYQKSYFTIIILGIVTLLKLTQ